MPYILNGVYLATTEDISILERSISQLEKYINRVEGNLRQRTEELNNSIRTLSNGLDEHLRLIKLLDKRLTDQEKAFRDAVDEFNRTLDAIASEVETETAYLDDVNEHLQKNDTALLELNGLNRQAAEQEIARRAEANEKLEALLAQQKAAAAAVAQAFTDLQVGFASLARVEEESTRLLEHSIMLMREAMVDVQSQATEELLQSMDAIQTYRQTKLERSQEENALLNRLLEVQTVMRQHLASMEASSTALAGHSQQAELFQQQRLTLMTNDKAHGLNQQALELLNSDEPELAAALLDRAAGLDPNSSILAENRILAHLRAGHLEKAGELLSIAMKEGENNAQFQHLAGMLMLSHGQYAEAIQTLQRAVELDPTDGEIYFSLGKGLYASGQVQPALEAWQTAARLAPALADADPMVKILLEEQQVREAGQ